MQDPSATSNAWPVEYETVGSTSGAVERRAPLTRVNSTNVLDEGLRIGEIGCRMNSKVKLVEIGVCRK
jgi:hypothetical protein